MINRRKVGTTSNHHAPYALGYTRVTMAGTTSRQLVRVSKSLKTSLSSDCTLQLECMKSESLVNADQHAALNTFPGLVHTARHTNIYISAMICEIISKEFPVTPWKSTTPEVRELTVREQRPKAGLVTGVKS